MVTLDTAGDFIPYCILRGSAAGERMASQLTVLPKASPTDASGFERCPPPITEAGTAACHTRA